MLLLIFYVIPPIAGIATAAGSFSFVLLSLVALPTSLVILKKLVYFIPTPPPPPAVMTPLP